MAASESKMLSSLVQLVEEEVVEEGFILLPSGTTVDHRQQQLCRLLGRLNSISTHYFWYPC
jgi:hypothetical protein